MRTLLTWILVIGFIAGLGTRVFASYDSGTPCSHEQHDCSGHDSSSSGDAHDHDGKCPAGHHHHCGTCLHSSPLGFENDLVHSLPLPESSRVRLQPDSQRLPDGPFPALDKPPLI